MKKKDGIVWISVVALLAVVVVVFRDRIHFDWAMFWQQLKHANAWHIAAAMALIYGTYCLRAVRWAVFVAPTKKVTAGSLVGPQFIGFTGVALFGRLADLTRPYLVARKIGLPLASQVAVYTVERMFDLGSAAIIFSGALAFTPKEMPHHEVFARTGLGSLAVTAAMAMFALKVRDGTVAKVATKVLTPVSKPLADSIAEKIAGFRAGLNALASLKEFVLVALFSLVMWGMIAEAYVQTAHAFVETPELAGLTFSRTMLLMAASIGAGLVQLPIVGWFTQIGVTATAMHEFYGAPIEAATACGATLLVVTYICIIPAGLIYARVEHVNLKEAASESEAAAVKDLEGAGTGN